MGKNKFQWLFAGLTTLALILALAGSSFHGQTARAQESTPEAGNIFGDGDGDEPDGEMTPFRHGNCDKNQHDDGCLFDLTVGANEVAFIASFVLKYDGHTAEDCVLVVAYEGTYEDVLIIDGGVNWFDTTTYDIDELAEDQAETQERYDCPARTLEDFPVLGTDTDLDGGFKTEATVETEVLDLGDV